MNRLYYARAIEGLCICIVATISVAGLWPFRAPKNDVAWLANDDGLRFGDHGSILSSGAFEAHVTGNNGSGSLEIWLERARSTGRKTILTFEGPSGTAAPFSLQQNSDTLFVQRTNTDEASTKRIAELVIKRALPQTKPLLVTITLGPRKTSVYFDGVPVGASEISGRTTGTFTGRLVLGNSLTASDSWQGRIRGLAIYEHELTAARVLQHHEDWIVNHRPMPDQEDQPAALYLFSEREGSVVHNQLGSSNDLIIPARFFVLHSAFLASPWPRSRPMWNYWRDAGVNIVGFIPFGFFFAAYFSTVRGTRNVAATTILLGFLTSLTIEVLQAYLPTRDSGMNDLITNTLGTVLGVLWYRSYLSQKIISKYFSKQLPT